jgi:hypothetical protein
LSKREIRVIEWLPTKNLLRKISSNTGMHKRTEHVQKPADMAAIIGNCNKGEDTMTFKSRLISHTKRAVSAGDVLTIARAGSGLKKAGNVDVKVTKNGFKLYNKGTGSVTYFDNKSAEALAEVLNAIAS